MTDQLEPVDDATQYRRRIDDSLARFSAAHDELEAEERERLQRRERFLTRIEQTKTKLQRVVSAVKHQSHSESEPGTDAEPDLETAAEPGTESPGESTEPDPGNEEPPRTRLQEKKQRRNRRAARIGRVTVASVAVLVFLLTGIAWGTKTWFDSKFRQVAALDEDSDDIRNAAAQLGDQNFLIVGSDTREGAEAEDDLGNTDQVPGARSDTVILAHVPEDRQRAVFVSFPRDLEITRPECERWDHETGEYGELMDSAEQVKLNTAFTIGGPRCITKAVQQLSGMKVNHFAGIDFHGFKAMVDVVGGVTVSVDEPIHDQELGSIVSEPGDIVMHGDQALNFVRARQVYSDPTFSDYGRMERQQQFLSSLLQAALSEDVLLDMGKLTRFIDAFAAATFGENISVDHLLTLAQSMRKLDADTVEFLTLPTVGEANERGNEVLLEEETQEVFEALIENTPLPGDEPEETTSSTEPSTQQAAPA